MCNGFGIQTCYRTHNSEYSEVTIIKHQFTESGGRGLVYEPSLSQAQAISTNSGSTTKTFEHQNCSKSQKKPLLRNPSSKATQLKQQRLLDHQRSKTRWWFQKFFIFTPKPWGFMIQFDGCIFFIHGLVKNHKLENQASKNIQIIHLFIGFSMKFSPSLLGYHYCWKHQRQKFSKKKHHLFHTGLHLSWSRAERRAVGLEP